MKPRNMLRKFNALAFLPMAMNQVPLPPPIFEVRTNQLQVALPWGMPFHSTETFLSWSRLLEENHTNVIFDTLFQTKFTETFFKELRCRNFSVSYVWCVVEVWWYCSLNFHFDGEIENSKLDSLLNATLYHHSSTFSLKSNAVFAGAEAPAAPE